MDRFDYSQIPEPTFTALRLYIQRRVRPGDFLMAVLSNDLHGACSHADHVNVYLIPVYAAYLHNEAPAACHGNPEAVKKWLEGKDARD